MIPERIEEYKALLAAATPGIWQIEGKEVWRRTDEHGAEFYAGAVWITDVEHEGNRNLIAAAPKAMADLLAALEETQQQNNRLEVKLQASRDSVYPLSVERDEYKVELAEAQQTIALKQSSIDILAGQVTDETALHAKTAAKLIIAEQTIARQRDTSLERLLLEMWDAAGIEEIYKYKNRIKVLKRTGLINYELFCDLTYGMFRDVYDTARDDHTTAEEAKASVKALLAAFEGETQP